MELITDFDQIRNEIGLDTPQQTLFVTAVPDAPKFASAILAKDKKKSFSLLVPQIENGNFSSGGCAYDVVTKHKINIVHYKSYFTWEQIDQNRSLADDEAKALSTILEKGSKLEIGADMPVDRLRKFSSLFKVQLKPWKAPGEVIVYKIKKSDVTNLFGNGIQQARKASLALVDSLRSASSDDKQALKKAIETGKDWRFEQLDRLMRDNRLNGVLASSRLNVQEIAGVEWDKFPDGLLALYDGSEILLISAKKLDMAHLKKKGAYKGINEALDALIGNGSLLGIEEKNLPMGTYNYLEAKKKEIGNGLRLWRERLGQVNLPYFIIAAQASKYSMENTLEFVEKQVKSGTSVSEREIEDKVQKFCKEFKTKHSIPLELRTGHMSVHAGARTPYPALPGTFEVTSSSKSVKIDYGTLVMKNGLVHGTSDQARTLVLSSQWKELLELLERSMLEYAIPACKAGVTGADIHKAGMELLVKEQKMLRDKGMMPGDRDIEKVYTRNIGHLLGGKQQPTIIFFTPADKTVKTEAGMIGSVEYQWPYKGYAVGTEDMFFITKTHGINITR